MTNYPQYPAGPPEPPPGPAPLGERPPSIAMAINLIWVGVALTVVTTALSLVNIDDSVQTALEGDTSGTLTESTARTGIIVASVVILLVGVGIYALLAVFLGKGKNWARIVYTVLAAIFGLLGVLSLGGDQPALTLVLGVVQLALITATLFFLWKPESTAWLTGKATA
jgi:uncharacterized membrane protein YuzA (DUF378 family)